MAKTRQTYLNGFFKAPQATDHNESKQDELVTNALNPARQPLAWVEISANHTRKISSSSDTLKHANENISNQLYELEDEVNSTLNLSEYSDLSDNSDTLQEGNLLGDSEKILKAFGLSKPRQTRQNTKSELAPINKAGNTLNFLSDTSILQKKKKTYNQLSKILSKNKRILKNLDIIDNEIGIKSDFSSEIEDESDSIYNDYHNSDLDGNDLQFKSNDTQLSIDFDNESKTINTDFVVDEGINNILVNSINIDLEKENGLKKAYRIHHDHLKQNQKNSFNDFNGLNFIHKINSNILDTFEKISSHKIPSDLIFLLGNLDSEFLDTRIKNTLICIGCYQNNKTKAHTQTSEDIQAIKLCVANCRMYNTNSMLSISFLDEILTSLLSNSPTEVLSNIGSFEYKGILPHLNNNDSLQTSLEGITSIVELYSEYFVCSTKFFVESINTSIQFSDSNSPEIKRKARRRSKKLSPQNINGILYTDIVHSMMLMVLLLLEIRMVPHSSCIKNSLFDIVKVIPPNDWVAINDIWTDKLKKINKELNLSNKLLLLTEITTSDRRMMVIRADLAYFTLLELYPNSSLPNKCKIFQYLELGVHVTPHIKKEFIVYLKNILTLLSNADCFNEALQKNTENCFSNRSSENQKYQHKSLLIGLNCVSILLAPTLLMPFVYNGNSSQEKINGFKLESNQIHDDQYFPVVMALYKRLNFIYRRINKSLAKDLDLLHCKDVLHLTLMWMSMTWLHKKDNHPVYSLN
ncbi:hypothetical protein BB561_005538 [Smittium simulii]|uniref:Uncharacterized protein n=1 Tax=Smittium simulii TaxID=133385 RepID=A0A2T9Y9V2_9FUNG|nr:hypothetical protein BB561_005538 [Smittium simulii]